MKTAIDGLAIICDNSGKTYLARKVFANTNSRILLNGIPSGFYEVTIISGNGVQTQQLVVKEME